MPTSEGLALGILGIEGSMKSFAFTHKLSHSPSSF